MGQSSGYLETMLIHVEGPRNHETTASCFMVRWCLFGSSIGYMLGVLSATKRPFEAIFRLCCDYVDPFGGTQRTMKRPPPVFMVRLCLFSSSVGRTLGVPSAAKGQFGAIFRLTTASCFMVRWCLFGSSVGRMLGALSAAKGHLGAIFRLS